MQLLGLGFHVQQLVRGSGPEPRGDISWVWEYSGNNFQIAYIKETSQVLIFCVTLGMILGKGRAQPWLLPTT